MTQERGGTPEEAQEPRREVNVDRANRSLERWLGVDLNAPREDQKGTDNHLYTTPRVPFSRREDDEVACIIVYNDTERTVKYLKPDGTPYAPEINPETEE